MLRLLRGLVKNYILLIFVFLQAFVHSNSTSLAAEQSSFDNMAQHRINPSLSLSGGMADLPQGDETSKIDLADFFDPETMKWLNEDTSLAKESTSCSGKPPDFLL